MKFLESITNNSISNFRITVYLFIFVLLFTFPKYLEILKDPSPLSTYSYFFEKIENPLSSVSGITNDTHGSKISFRLTVPIICKILGIDSRENGNRIIGIYLLQSLMLFPFLYIIQNILRQFTNPLNSFLFTLSISAIYLGQSFFWDYDFWFDGFAFLFILLGIYSQNGFNILLFLQLACWTDERAFIALPGVYLFHILKENDFGTTFRFVTVLKNLTKNTSTWVLITGILYLAIRGSIHYFYGLSTPSGEEAGVSLSLVPFQIQHRLVGVFFTFEGLWIIFIFAMNYIFSKKEFELFWLIIAILFLQILVSYCVFDITRSISYAFPIFIISFIIFTRIKQQSTKIIVVVSTLVCLLIPTQFLIYFPRQIPWTIFSYDELRVIIKSVLIRL